MPPTRVRALALLAFAQTVPTAFALGALPLLWRHQGYSLLAIGALQLLYLPWVLKVLWAPVVDRVSQGGRRRHHFLMVAQALVVLAAALLALRPPAAEPLPTFVAVFLLACASATADSAGDALAVRLTPQAQSEHVNGRREAASFLASAVGVGGGLYLTDRFGWLAAVGAVTVLASSGVAAVVALRNATLSHDTPEEGASGWAGPRLRSAFARPGALAMFAVLALGSLANRAAGANPQVLLADLGLPSTMLALVTGIGIPATGVGGALLAGWVATRAGTARLLPLALVGKGVVWIAVATTLVVSSPPAVTVALLFAANAIFGIVATSLGALMMRWSRRGAEATDMACFFSVAATTWLVLQPLSGLAADVTGYAGLFMIAAGVAWLAALVVSWLATRRPELIGQGGELFEVDTGSAAS